MRTATQTLFLAALSLAGCVKRAPDLSRALPSPSGQVIATFSGYQPKGAAEGVATIAFSQKGADAKPQIRFGHMLKVRADWVDEHTFAIVYDTLDPRRLTSPIYSTSESGSAVNLIVCDMRYLDCSPLLKRFRSKSPLIIDQFPDGDWPTLSKTPR